MPRGVRSRFGAPNVGRDETMAWRQATMRSEPSFAPSGGPDHDLEPQDSYQQTSDCIAGPVVAGADARESVAPGRTSALRACLVGLPLDAHSYRYGCGLDRSHTNLRKCHASFFSPRAYG